MRHALLCISLIGIAATAPAADPPAESLPPAALFRVGPTRFRVGQGCRCVVYSADGKTLFTAGNDGIIRVWDAATGREAKQWSTKGGAVNSMRLAPDGKKLAVGDNSRTIGIWDTATAEKRFTLQTNSYGFVSITWTADGKRLVISGQNDAMIRIVDAETGTEAKRWQVTLMRTRAVGGLAVSPDDQMIVAIGYQGEIQTWDFEGKEGIKFESPTGGAVNAYANRQVVFSPDGKWLAASALGQSPIIWDAKTGKIEKQISPMTHRGVNMNALGLAFSPNSRFLAAAASDGSVKIFGVASGKELRSLDTGKSFPHMLAFSPDGKQLAAVSVAATLHVWDLTTGKPLFDEPGHRGSVTGLAFLADGRLVSQGQDGTIRCWDLREKKEIDRQTSTVVVGTCLGVDPDAKSVIYVGQNLTQGFHVFRRWIPGSGKVPTTISTPSTPSNFVQMTPNGRFAIVQLNTPLRLVDLAAGTEINFMNSRGSLNQSVTISPDGRFVALQETNQKPKITVWETATKGTRDFALGLSEGYVIVKKMTFTPDCRGLATACGWEVSIWEMATGISRLRFAGPPQSVVTGVAFSPDSRLVAVCANTGALRLFDAITGMELGSVDAHRADITALAFSKDGTRLASGANDGTMIVWDVAKLAHDKLPRKLGADATAVQIDEWWNDLGVSEGNRANVAVWRLSEAPADKIVALARERLKPSARPSLEQIERWIADLSNEKFAVRTKASNSLAAAGDDAKTALEAALKKSPSAEAQTRIEKLLSAIQGGASASFLRPLRVVEVLDRLGTPEARKLLEEMATQSYGETVRAELERIRKRNESDAVNKKE